MLDYNAQFEASSYHNNDWKNPRLGSYRGVHNNPSEYENGTWWQVTMPKDKGYKLWMIQ